MTENIVTDKIPPQTPEQDALTFDVQEYLRDVIDPELGINVVDLGLVYDVWAEENAEGKQDVHVNMTLTSPACPLTELIEVQAHSAIIGSGLTDNLTIHWVWLPAWNQQMITEEGREQLRALGFAV